AVDEEAPIIRPVPNAGQALGLLEAQACRELERARAAAAQERVAAGDVGRRRDGQEADPAVRCGVDPVLQEVDGEVGQQRVREVRVVEDVEAVDRQLQGGGVGEGGGVCQR